MDGEKLLDHVEPLAPGFATLAVGAAILPTLPEYFENQFAMSLLTQPFIAAASVTSVAYLIGVLELVSTRAFIDPLSEWSLRPVFLHLWRPDDFESWSFCTINDKYRSTLAEALAPTADETKRTEVLVRRRRGRLVRAALAPAGLLAWSSSVLALVAVFAATLVFYAYAELSIYLEARLAA